MYGTVCPEIDYNNVDFMTYLIYRKFILLQMFLFTSITYISRANFNYFSKQISDTLDYNIYTIYLVVASGSNIR